MTEAENKVTACVEEYCTAASEYGRRSKEKIGFEQAIQQCHNSLWSFTQPYSRMDGLCGCDNRVSYVHSYQTALYNETMHADMVGKIRKLHELLSGPFISAYIRQMFAKLDLASVVISSVQSSSSGSSVVSQFKTLCDLFDTLLRSIGASEDAQRDAQLQRLLLYVGTKLLRLAHRSSKAAPLSLLAAGEPFTFSVPVTQAPTEVLRLKDVHSFLAARVFEKANCASWAFPLLQPSVSQILDERWLSQLLRQDWAMSRYLSDSDMLACLGQVPWLQFASEPDPQRIFDSVLTPLQLALSQFGPQALASPPSSKKRQLVLALVKFIAVVACVQPKLCLFCANMLMHGPWPAPSMAVTVLGFLPFHALQRPEIVRIFADLYALSNTPPESFARTHPTQRRLHRDAFLTHISNQQPLVSESYALDPPLARANQNSTFPQFLIMVVIAYCYSKHDFLSAPSSTSSSDFLSANCNGNGVRQTPSNRSSASTSASNSEPEPDWDPRPWNREQEMLEEDWLAQLIAQELLYYALLIDPRAFGSNVTAVMVRTEACRWLGALCSCLPTMMDFVVLEICQYAKDLTGDPRQVLERLPFHKWVPSADILNRMKVLLVQRPLNISCIFERSDPTKTPPEIATAWVNLALGSMPPNVFERRPNKESEILMGSALFGEICWANCPPSVRSKAIILLLASHPMTLRNWWWTVAMGNITEAILAPPIDRGLILELVRALQSVTLAAPFLNHIAIYVLCCLSITHDDIRTQDAPSPSQTPRTAWLLERRIGQCIEVIALEMESTFAGYLLQRCFDVGMEAGDDGGDILADALDGCLRAGGMRTGPEILRVLASSLKPGPKREKAKHLWICAFSNPRVDWERVIGLADAFAQYIYYDGESLIPFSRALTARLEPVERKFIIGLVSGGTIWIAYTLLLTFGPATPPLASESVSIQPSSASTVASFFRTLPRTLSGGKMSPPSGSTPRNSIGSTSKCPEDDLPDFQPLLGHSPSLRLVRGDSEVLFNANPAAKSEVNTSMVSTTSMGMFREIAIMLGSAELALPFWEMFFVLALEWLPVANAAGFNTKSFESSSDEHFSSIAGVLENVDRQLAALYWGFTRWTSDLLPGRGRFMQGAGVTLYTEKLKSRYPCRFPAIIQNPISVQPRSAAPADVTAVAHFQDEIGPSKIATLVPSAHNVLEHDQELDIEAVEAIQNQVATTLSLLNESGDPKLIWAQIASLNLDGPSSPPSSQSTSSPPSIPVMATLSDTLVQYHERCRQMLGTDESMLLFSRQLYSNQPTWFTVSVRCLENEDCIPASFTVQETTVVHGMLNAPGPTPVLDLLKSNRELYQQHCVHLLESAADMARCLLALHYVNVDLQNSDSLFERKSAIALFFSLLPVVGGGLLSSSLSFVRSKIVAILRNLGIRHIARSPEAQLPLLVSLLDSRKQAESYHQYMSSSRTTYDGVSAANGASDSAGQRLSTSEAMVVLQNGPVGTTVRGGLQRFAPQLALDGVMELVDQVLTPDCLLEHEAYWDEYLHLLEALSLTGPGLVPEDLSSVAGTFDIERFMDIYVSQLASDPNMAIREQRLFKVLADCLARKGLLSLGTTLLQRLVLLRFPEHLPRCFSLALKASQAGRLPSTWPSWFLPLPLVSLDVSMRLRVVDIITETLPVPSEYCIPLLDILKTTFFTNKEIISTLTEESNTPTILLPDSCSNPDAGRPIWATVRRLICALLHPHKRSPTDQSSANQNAAPIQANDSQSSLEYLPRAPLSRVLAQLQELTVSCPPIINFLWEIYLEAFPSLVSSPSAPSHGFDCICTHLRSIDWSHTRFHLEPDGRVLRKLLSNFSKLDTFICELFNNLDWEPLLLFGGDAGLDQALVLFLQIWMALRVFRRREMVPAITALVRKSLEDFASVWTDLDPTALTRAFDGSYLTSILRCGAHNASTAIADGDVTLGMIEACRSLYNLTLRMKDGADIAHFVGAEVASCVRFSMAASLDNEEGRWRIPQRERLVAEVLVPLCEKFSMASTSSGPFHDSSASELLFHLVHCADVASYPDPFVPTYRLPAVLPTTARPVETATATDPAVILAENDIGPVLIAVKRFCLSLSSPQVILHFVSLASKEVRDATVLSEVLEYSLRSYFGHTKSETALQEAANELIVNQEASPAVFLDDGPRSLVDTCRENRCCLAAIVLAERHRQQIRELQGIAWEESACSLAEKLKWFTARPDRPFDLLFLWIWLVALVSDPRWSLVEGSSMSRVVQELQNGLHELVGSPSAQDGIKGFIARALAVAESKPARSVFGMEIDETLEISYRVRLAARTILIYLHKMISSKKDTSLSHLSTSFGPSSQSQASAPRVRVSRELLDELDALIAVQNAEPYASSREQFQSFFGEVESLLSPLSDYVHFKKCVAMLFPSAPYLAGI